MSPSTPERRCLGCGARDEPSAMLRLVALAGEVRVDLRGKAPGRGAWVHPGCVAGLSERALRRGLSATGVGLIDQARRVLLVGVRDGLSISAAAGAIVTGQDVLSAVLREGRISVVVVASDAAARTLRVLKRAGAVPFVVVPLTREDLGHQIGRAPVAAVGVRSMAATKFLRRKLQLFGALSE